MPKQAMSQIKGHLQFKQKYLNYELINNKKKTYNLCKKKKGLKDLSLFPLRITIPLVTTFEFKIKL